MQVGLIDIEPKIVNTAYMCFSREISCLYHSRFCWRFFEGDLLL